jgi:hypothetical protein
MSSYILCVVAIAALALGPILAECRPTFAQARASAPPTLPCGNHR